MVNVNKGRLYLIPCPIAEDNASWTGQEIKNCLSGLSYYVVERAKTARKFIKMMYPEVNLPSLTIEEFDKDDPGKNLKALLQPLLDGHDMGLMSEAGNPCIADPGSLLVALAHQQGIDVRPLVGPSSILMALISSGFNGQNFTFNGYLPNKRETLIPRLKAMETNMQKGGQTQIFMETPYRNEFIIDACRQNLNIHTLLCVACDIGAASQSINTKTIGDWRKADITIYHKRPTIFLIGKK
jgi:16S rRNA (cytidine1402-2'-O)-methyltransferase